LNESGATNLIGTISKTSFTWLATFERKHHSPPYSIFYASPQILHPNVTLSLAFPLGFLLFQNFG
jgi:hypothetical protein